MIGPLGGSFGVRGRFGAGVLCFAVAGCLVVLDTAVSIYRCVVSSVPCPLIPWHPGVFHVNTSFSVNMKNTRMKGVQGARRARYHTPIYRHGIQRYKRPSSNGNTKHRLRHARLPRSQAEASCPAHIGQKQKYRTWVYMGIWEAFSTAWRA